MADLLVRNATLPDGRTGVDVLVAGDRIVNVSPRIDATAAEVVDAQGYLLTPPFVDAHFHMDATLSYGLPRVNQSGTLLEGIALWGELKPLLTQDALVERALTYCDWAVAKGLLAIRSHVDVCDPRLQAVEALLHVREKVKPYLDLQLVAFPQDGVPAQPRRARAPGSRAADGGRRRRRDSAFRADDGRRRGKRACAVRAGGGTRGASSTCIATRPTIRIRGISKRWRCRRCGWAFRAA
jgi:cytosine/adenosine deaminase-related metal-dependent hydrolase